MAPLHRHHHPHVPPPAMAGDLAQGASQAEQERKFPENLGWGRSPGDSRCLLQRAGCLWTLPSSVEATLGALKQPRSTNWWFGATPSWAGIHEPGVGYGSTTASAPLPSQGPRPFPRQASAQGQPLSLQRGPSTGSLVLGAQPCPTHPPLFSLAHPSPAPSRPYNPGFLLRAPPRVHLP